jgi:hypothetical protein
MYSRVPVRRRRSSYFGPGLMVILVVLLLAGSCGAYISAVKGSVRTVTTRVTDKQRVCESNGGSCKYLIYTDSGTYKDTDSMIFGKFRSSDLYGNIQRGKTYTFKVSGWRLPFFSGYPNIISIQK